jgi:hypothetical protein
MTFEVSNTMKVLFSEEKEIDYIVIKVGENTYSTSFEEIRQGLIKGNMQIVDTKGIGTQAQLWIKGNLTEKESHQKLPETLPIELNIYFHEK